MKDFLHLIRARVPVGGLEVSDSMMRYSYFDGQLWQLLSQRLPAGLIEGGIVKNREGARASFVAFRQAIAKHQGGIRARASKRISVILTMGSFNIYSQVFNLPSIQGQNLNEAISLNLQMLAPGDVAQLYSSAQMVGDSPEGFEMLAAFAPKAPVDDLAGLLYEGGFFTVAVEPRSLALARLARERGVGFDVEKPSVIVNIDESGIDFLVIRHGQLYFNYFTPWSLMQHGEKEISKNELETVIIRNLNQVLNFSTQHFKESVSDVFLSMSGLLAEATKAIKENFSLNVRELKLETDKPINPEWFVVLGSGIRGAFSRSADKEITLTSEKALEEFRKEHVVHFLRSWAIGAGVSIALMLGAYIAFSELVLMPRAERALSVNAPAVSVQDRNEFKALQDRALEFNRSVQLVASLAGTIRSQSALVEHIQGIADANRVEVSEFAFTDAAQPLRLRGRAPSLEGVLSFKNALSQDSWFANVELPLQEVRQDFSFSISFSLASPKTN